METNPGISGTSESANPAELERLIDGSRQIFKESHPGLTPEALEVFAQIRGIYELYGDSTTVIGE